MASTTTALPHPFDPLCPLQIEKAASIVRATHGQLAYNAISLLEPRKKEMQAWLESQGTAPRPPRLVEVVCVGKCGSVFDGILDLGKEEITVWNKLEGVQPILTLEDLVNTELYVRKDPKVIEQCGILGIPPEDMHKVYADPWTIGYDERFGSDIRLQQALMYYRRDIDDCQYAFPLDFTPIVNTLTGEVIHIDIPEVRRPLNKVPSNYFPKHIAEDAKAKGKEGDGYRTDLKPINITQPDGVSFKMDGNYIEWANWRMHIGFNYKEGIVLRDISLNDDGTRRSLFYRMSLVEMNVPYGNPERPHQRKHAFDLGEYGGGYMTNSLALGCDCKGAIHYLDAHFPNKAGAATTIKNAICIHEEDSGLAFKHSDFRDNSLIVTRARKLVISQIFTAANYEYCIYWYFHIDGTIQLEIKLSGILNTYAMHPDEDTKGWGTQVHSGVNAHNHQHLFCLRVDPQLDGPNNTIVQVDSASSPHPVGSPENPYGNGFYAKRQRYTNVHEAMSDYDSSTTRTWDITNESRLHPYSKKPSSYKLVSRECPKLLAQPGSLVWKRAGFTHHNIHVTPYADDQLYPAGKHVPQTSGEPSLGLPQWIEAAKDTPIDNADVVLWHIFGLTHFPAAEDFPVMPVEPFSLLLRPRNFWLRNPVLDVRPSFVKSPSDVLKGAITPGGLADKMSALAFGAESSRMDSDDETKPAPGNCCLN